MFLVPPVEYEITASNILINEADILIYEPDTPFSAVQEVQHEGTIYTCLQSSTNIVPGSDILYWLEKSKTNYLKMFDSYMSTKTTNNDSITYTLLADDVDIIAFFGVIAQTVRVEVFNENDVSFYDKTIKTFDRDVVCWQSWTSAKPEFITNAFFKDLPMIFKSKIKITLENADGIVECGHCAFGQSKLLGVTLSEPYPTSSIRNIITKDKQADGSVKTQNSMTYKRILATVILDTKRASEVQNILEKYTVEPCLWLADDREGGTDSLMAFGIYKDFDMRIGLDYSHYELEIEGVV